MKKDLIEKKFPERLDDIAERSVNQSNTLIRSIQTFSLDERRIFAAAVATTDSVPQRALAKAIIPNSASGALGWTVRISAMEFAELYKLDKSNAYDQLKKAGGRLFERHIRLVEQGNKGKKVSLIRWCSRFTYHDHEGWAEIAFTPEIAPHLLGLRSNFTSYKLGEASTFRSGYTWKLFELCRSWKDRGRFVMKIEEFEAAMDAPASCRGDFYNLQARVIKPAVAELMRKSNLIVQCHKIKYLRKIVELEFVFMPNPQSAFDFAD